MRRLFMLLVLMLAGIVNADVLVKGPLAADGYLESLQVDGVEFFNARVDISRGTYIHQGGVINLKKENCPFELSYSPVENDSFTASVTNKSGKAAVFFAILRSEVQACKIDNGAMQSTRPLANKTNARQSSWYYNGKVLEISGHNALWPWSGDTTVVEMALPAGKTSQITFKGRIVTDSEQKFIDAMPQPPVQTEADLAQNKLADIEVFSPKDWQVYQRQTVNSGPVRISGVVRCGCSMIGAAVSGIDKDGKAIDKQMNIPVDVKTGGFDAVVDLPAGGWYKMVLTAAQVKEPIVVEKFGVGEVFVTAGQSNSTNCGQVKTKQESGMVAAFNGLDWRRGDDPFWGTHDTSGGGSTWASLGDVLYGRYHVPIGFAVSGHGGTNTDQWQPNNDKNGLFHHTMTRIWQLGPGGFRAVLWHQGESDCGYNSTEKTYNNMVRIIRASQQAAGYPVVWVVAKVSYIPQAQPQLNEAVRNAHQKLWDDHIALQGPDTDMLKEEYRDFDGKGIHFSPKGLKKMAEMWADDISLWLDKQLSVKD
ncbi:MAG: hypothetical protein JEZ07_01530 [Phycisphaerae bacterium]|nr:hypothetical protein [Phycisphaerae bacterium]